MSNDGLNLTIFRERILAISFVFGFLPILSPFFTTSNVPKEVILILFVFINSEIKDSKKLSIISPEIFFEKPIF